MAKTDQDKTGNAPLDSDADFDLPGRSGATIAPAEQQRAADEMAASRARARRPKPDEFAPLIADESLDQAAPAQTGGGVAETPEKQQETEDRQSPEFSQKIQRYIENRMRQTRERVQEINKQIKPIKQEEETLDRELFALKMVALGARLADAGVYIAEICVPLLGFWFLVIPILLAMIIAVAILLLAFTGILKGKFSQKFDKQLKALKKQVAEIKAKRIKLENQKMMEQRHAQQEIFQQSNLS